VWMWVGVGGFLVGVCGGGVVAVGAGVVTNNEGIPTPTPTPKCISIKGDACSVKSNSTY
jgi:hypothetical protein